MSKLALIWGKCESVKHLLFLVQSLCMSVIFWCVWGMLAYAQSETASVVTLKAVVSSGSVLV